MLQQRHGSTGGVSNVCVRWRLVLWRPGADGVRAQQCGNLAVDTSKPYLVLSGGICVAGSRNQATTLVATAFCGIMAGITGGGCGVAAAIQRRMVITLAILFLGRHALFFILHEGGGVGDCCGDRRINVASRRQGGGVRRGVWRGGATSAEKQT
jgi:hypothetical protein